MTKLLKWYWFPLHRTPMIVTFHLLSDVTVVWTGIFGVALRWKDNEYFFGCVSSHGPARIENDRDSSTMG